MSARRTRPVDSIPSAVGRILDEYHVPVPTSVIRIVASERRGDVVTAEHLARIASYERATFFGRGLTPMLCDALDGHGHAFAPRIWVRGDWRLQRRLLTPDAIPGVKAALAAHLCDEMRARGASAGSALANVALQAVGEVLGPVSAYMPGTPDDWADFRARVVATNLNLVHNVTGATSGQVAAEKHLEGLPASVLYFGAA